MKMRLLLFALASLLLLMSACAAGPVEMRQTPTEVSGAVILLEEPTLTGRHAEFGKERGVDSQVQRQLRQTLQQQGVRVIEDPAGDYHAVLKTEITVDRGPNIAGVDKYMTVAIDLVSQGEFLGSGTSGRESVRNDLETNYGGYIRLTALPKMAVNDLFSRPIARDISSGTMTATTASVAPQTPSTATVEEPAVSMPASTVFASATPQRQSYALIIGVEDYRDLPPPTGARGDAEKFAELVTTSMGLPEQNVRLLTDSRATRGDILSELRWLENNVPAGGRIYLYFSGHGSPDTSEGTSFLLPYEATPESMEYTGLALSMVIDQLEATSAREIIAFVDACFSGSGGRSVLPEGTRPLVPVQQTEPQSKVAIFSASQAAEISGNRADDDTGLFTHYLVEGLGLGRADLDGDGQISLRELEAYVAPRVSREARQLSREQNPSLFIGQDMGEADDVVVTWGIAAD